MTLAQPDDRTEAVVFTYARPDLEARKKRVVMLARTDAAFCSVQVVREGGENNLHSHPRLDGFWFVLAGRARFYTENDEVVADLGPHEGVLIPRGYPYWFESSGDEVLEIFQVEASVGSLGKSMMEDRVDHVPMNAATTETLQDET